MCLNRVKSPAHTHHRLIFFANTSGKETLGAPFLSSDPFYRILIQLSGEPLSTQPCPSSSSNSSKQRLLGFLPSATTALSHCSSVPQRSSDQAPLRRPLCSVASSAGEYPHPQPSDSLLPGVFLRNSANRRPPVVVKQPILFIPVSGSFSILLFLMHRTDRTSFLAAFLLFIGC